MAELELPPARFKVVLNQQDSRRAVTLEQIQEAVVHSVDVVLPFSPSDLVRAVDAGELVPPDKKSPFAGEIRKWASALAPVTVTAGETRRRFAFWR
jgi:Flp pilus assembly CpaE family ATPase